MEGIHGGGWNTVVAAATSHPMNEEGADLRRGPWTVEEDFALINFISINGEGRWNSLARSAGLKRTGKSCRLRWLNYLRPDVRRGNITPEEQLLILELHSRWGNRWSKIAQHLPGRTDNEIKNYWRTRVQKHAKQLQCDVNSKQFKDVMRYLWMPRLLERIQAAAAANSSASSSCPDDVVQVLNQQQQQLPVSNCNMVRYMINDPDQNSSMGCCSNSTSDSMSTQMMTIGGITDHHPPPVITGAQHQVNISAADHHDQGTGLNSYSSTSQLDWYGAAAQGRLLSASASTTSSETVPDQNNTSAVQPQPPINYSCGYYDFNPQDCYFSPATLPPNDPFGHQDCFWNMDYGDDDRLWAALQQQLQ